MDSVANPAHCRIAVSITVKPKSVATSVVDGPVAQDHSALVHAGAFISRTESSSEGQTDGAYQKLSELSGWRRIGNSCNPRQPCRRPCLRRSHASHVQSSTFMFRAPRALDLFAQRQPRPNIQCANRLRFPRQRKRGNSMRMGLLPSNSAAKE